MVICLERGTDLHMAHLMPLPLTVSCSSEIKIGFILLVLAHPGRPGERAVKRVCVCARVRVRVRACVCVSVFVVNGSGVFPAFRHSLQRLQRSWLFERVPVDGWACGS